MCLAIMQYHSRLATPGISCGTISALKTCPKCQGKFPPVFLQHAVRFGSVMICSYGWWVQAPELAAYEKVVLVRCMIRGNKSSEAPGAV